MSILNQLNERGAGALPGLIEILDAEECCLELREELMAQTATCPPPRSWLVPKPPAPCGTFVNLAEGAEGFTTIELKSSFVGTKCVGARRKPGTLPSPAAIPSPSSAAHR